MAILKPGDLEMRTRLALILIVDYIHSNVIHQAPPHSEVVRLWNETLPCKYARGSGGKVVNEAVTSKEISFRASEVLREVGLLETAPNMQFNLQPTALGFRYAELWRASTLEWVREEHAQWEKIKPRVKGETRKSRAPLERLEA